MKISKPQQILDRMKMIRMRMEHIMKIRDVDGWDTGIITTLEHQHRHAQMNLVIAEIEKIIER